VRLPITLGQFLKASWLVSSGGEAKNLISLGMVRVNGEVEERRGRKLSHGDLVETGTAAARVQAAASDPTSGETDSGSSA
jgi:ribosome-associated protein